MSNYASFAYSGVGFQETHPEGYLHYLDYWLTLPSVSGGAGWYTIEDGSTSIVDTFDPSVAIIANPTNTITISLHGLFTGQKVVLDTNTGGFIKTQVYYVRAVDNSTIKLYLTLIDSLADTNAVALSVPGSSTVHLYSCPYKVYSNVLSPVLNNNTTKFVEIWWPYNIDNTAGVYGVPRCFAHLWWDTTNHIPRGNWSRGGTVLIVSGMPTTGTAYFSGDSNWFLIGSSYGGNGACFAIDDWTYNTAGYEAPSKIGIVANTPAAGRDVTIILGTGQAANFTPGKYYYIYDFDGHSQVEYVLCKTSDNNTTIVVDFLTYSYPVGAVIGSYPHRFCTLCGASNNPPYILGNSASCMQVPYYSVYPRTVSSTPCERIFHNQTGWIRSVCRSNVDILLDTLSKLDNEKLLVQRHVFSECADGLNSTMATGAKVIGTPDHIYVCNGLPLTRLVDTVLVNGVNYLYFGDVMPYLYPSPGNVGLLMPLE